MNKTKTHQEQNTVLAKAVNHLKMELRRSRHEVLTLRHQLQVSREQNVQLANQQTTLFDTIEQFENNLDEVFANNSFAYVLLSTSIKGITAKNPRRSDVCVNDASSTSTDITSPLNISQSNTVGKPHQSMQDDDKDGADILNTAFLDISDHGFSESVIVSKRNNSLATSSKIAIGSQILIEKPSRLPVPTRRSVNLKRNSNDSHSNANESNQTMMLTRRKRNIVNYREQPINRKMRRTG